MSFYEYKANVKRVIDGDTLECNVDLGFKITIDERFRLAKIDCPELSTPEGKEVKAKVIQMLEGKDVHLIVERKDNYGRWLATVLQDNVNINEYLLQNGMAKVYQ